MRQFIQGLILGRSESHSDVQNSSCLEKDKASIGIFVFLFHSFMQLLLFFFLEPTHWTHWKALLKPDPFIQVLSKIPFGSNNLSTKNNPKPCPISMVYANTHSGSRT